MGNIRARTSASFEQAVAAWAAGGTTSATPVRAQVAAKRRVILGIVSSCEFGRVDGPLVAPG